jgi:uncharacterized protein (TIGR02391 family)
MKRNKTPELHSADLSFQEMEKSIPKIERRLLDLNSIDVDEIISLTNPSITALEGQLDDLLVTIYGANTVEYSRYKRIVTNLYRGPIYMGRLPSLEQIREGFRKGVSSSIETLEAIKRGFLENLEDAGMMSSGKTLKAYNGLELHLSIERAVGKLFRDGHYANAIEDAVKALNALVRLNSGVDDKDGTSLMESVFNPGSPVLKFNDLVDQSDRDEQKGFMFLFSGAVAGLRNPRAHKIIDDDPEMALEFIAFVSLLAKLADKARK